MAEIFEYCLVVMASTLFVAGSVAAYGSFTAFASGLQFRVESSAIARLASDALAGGAASGTFTVPASTISCHGGVLTVSSGGMVDARPVPAGCDFAVSVQGGVHTFEFAYRSGGLSAEVS
jgi:hypothetical protein